MEIGIIGLANVGKSTLFNALTKADVPAVNYPFCTIEPNVGVAIIPDMRFREVAKIVKPEIVTGAVIKFVDIAGLVRGASRGEGLGNKFLAHIRDVDAVIHVVRAFSDSNVAKVEGEINPLKDIEIVETELLLADMQAIEKRIDKVKRLLKTGEQKYKEQLANLQQAYEHLDQGRADLLKVDMLPADLMLLSVKPVLYVLNIDEGEFLDQEQSQEITARLQTKINKPNSRFMTISAVLELELADLAPAEKQEFLHELDLEESGLDRVIKVSKELLDLIVFYTIKGKETRAWLVPRGTPAPEAAGRIHTDMQRGFIKAEVVTAERLLVCGSFSKARERGEVRIEGKDYQIDDGDVVLFHFNV